MTNTDTNIDERLKAIEAKLNMLPIADISHILKVMNNLIMATQNKASQEIASLRYEINNTKQSIHLVARHIPVPDGRSIRCLFIVNYIPSWGVYAPVYDAMRKADDFEPIVITVRDDEAFNRIYGMGASEEEAHRYLDKLSVPHLRLNMPNTYAGLDIIKALAPDIIFRQTPWDGSLPLDYRTPELLFARLCYIDYSFAMPRKDRPHAEPPPAGQSAAYHANEPFHQVCWKIFCETDMHKDMYARASTRGAGNLISVGYTKFDELMESARNNPPFWPIKNADGKKRFRVIWAPHFSVMKDSLGFGMFQDVYKDMLAWGQERSDIEFALRAHPMLFATLVNQNILPQTEIDAFHAAWNALPNTGRCDDANYGPFFAASDTLVTDGVGFFADYQLFKKPLIFLDSQRHTGFNEAGELVMQSANRVTDVAGARALCDRLQKGEPDPMREIQARNLPHIHPFPGKSAIKILDAIRHGLAEERGK